jgi:hypothetical protein
MRTWYVFGLVAALAVGCSSNSSSSDGGGRGGKGGTGSGAGGTAGGGSTGTAGSTGTGGSAATGGSGGIAGVSGSDAGVPADAGPVDAPVTDGGPGDGAVSDRVVDVRGDAGIIACGDAACGSDEVCVANQVVGGFTFWPNDAGVCTPPRIMVPEAPSFCSLPPTLHCAARPGGCASSCDLCSLCMIFELCKQQTTTSVRCVLEAA